MQVPEVWDFSEQAIGFFLSCCCHPNWNLPTHSVQSQSANIISILVLKYRMAEQVGGLQVRGAFYQNNMDEIYVPYLVKWYTQHFYRKAKGCGQ